ncbi:hypothetical protein SCH4B_4200 [Ruegeria sp. TrichCH4B]|nr:hypothetical protein SCH4B_4200 [Ruegeria sp. TrichCH4B]
MSRVSCPHRRTPYAALTFVLDRQWLPAAWRLSALFRGAGHSPGLGRSVFPVVPACLPAGPDPAATLLSTGTN